MTALLDQHQAAQHRAKAEALALYATLLKRAATPESDDQDQLADCMELLGIDDAQLPRDVNAVARHATLTANRLDRQERERIRAESTRREQEAIDALRQHLAGLIAAVGENDLRTVRDAIERAVIAAERGKPGQPHHARAEQWRALLLDLARARNESTAALDNDDANAREIARLEREHPQALDKALDYPKRPSDPARPAGAATDGKGTFFSIGNGYAGVTPSITRTNASE